MTVQNISGRNSLLGAACWRFGVQEAWEDEFCISHTEPESGTDRDRVTGGRRLSDALQKHKKI